PGSFNPFTAQDQYVAQHGDPTKQFASFTAGLTKTSLTQSLAEYMIEYLKVILTTQFTFKNATTSNANSMRLYQLLQDPIYKANLSESLKLFNQIDLPYVKKCEIIAG